MWRAAVGLGWLAWGGPLVAQAISARAESLFQHAVESARRRTGAGYRAAAAGFDSAARLVDPRAPADAAVLRVYAAEMHLALGRPDRARFHADTAVAVLRRDGRRGSWLPRALTAAGESRSSLGQASEAVPVFREGLAHTASLLRDTHADPAATRRLRQIEGTLRSDMGNTLLELGAPDSASVHLELALIARAAARDTLGIAYTLNNLGRLLQTLGRADSARALFARAATLFAERADATGLATAFTNTGFSFELSRQPAPALEWHRRALTALATADHPALLAVTLNNLGRNYLLLGSLTAAADDLTAGVRVARAADDDWRAAWNVTDLGRVTLARGDRDSAIALLTAGRVALAAANDPVRESGALLHLGRARAGTGPGRDPPGARAAFAAADSARRRVGSRVPSDADRVSFGEQDVELTEQWTLAWLSDAGQDPARSRFAALGVAELGRARSLLALMRGTEAAAPVGGDPEAVARLLLEAAFGTEGNE